MYSEVARARDVRKILQAKKEKESLEMLGVLSDDDFVPTNEDELKLILRCGIQFWETYAKDFSTPEEDVKAIQKAVKKAIKEKKCAQST